MCARASEPTKCRAFLVNARQGQARKKKESKGETPSPPFFCSHQSSPSTLHFFTFPIPCPGVHALVSQWHPNLLPHSRNPLGSSSQAPPHLLSSPKTFSAPLPAQKQVSPRLTPSEPPTLSSSSPLPPPTLPPPVCLSISSACDIRILKLMIRAITLRFSSQRLRGSST